MGLFGRRRHDTPDRADWQPDGTVLTDEGAEDTYGVVFTLDSAPRASMTIWVYPGRHGERRGAYQMTFRCEYSYDQGRGREPWTREMHDADYEGETFDSYDRCADAALAAAELLATTPRQSGVPDYHEPCSAFFEWNGVPW